MAEPADGPRVVAGAARLVQRGELVVFGSSDLAFRLVAAPRSRDCRSLVRPARAPETFSAPKAWRSRAKAPARSRLRSASRGSSADWIG
jgi:hypothetical protein